MKKKHTMRTVIFLSIVFFIVLIIFHQSNYLTIIESDDLLTYPFGNSYVFVPCIDITESKLSNQNSTKDTTHIIEKSNISSINERAVISHPTTNEINKNLLPNNSHLLFEFSGLNEEMVIASNTKYMLSTDSTISLTIDQAAWAPYENTVLIGLCNFEDNKCYAYKIANWGTDHVCEYIFPNLPAGVYYVYAHNASKDLLTSGIIHFSVAIK